MKTLIDSVHWEAKDHPTHSRGLLISLPPINPTERDFPRDFPEECQVMTRRQRTLIFNFSRTTVFDPRLPGQGGILKWNTSDEETLLMLHKACMKICSEVGFSEFCVMCEAKGPSAEPYWQEMLGPNYLYLRNRS